MSPCASFSDGCAFPSRPAATWQTVLAPACALKGFAGCRSEEVTNGAEVEETPAAEAAPAPGEPMDLKSALKASLLGPAWACLPLVLLAGSKHWSQ